MSNVKHRVQTLLAGVFSGALIVVVLLGFGGTQLTGAEQARAGVDQVLAEWSAIHQDFQVEDILVLPAGDITVDLTGPGEPPGLDELAKQLRVVAGSNVPVHVTWVKQDRATIPAGDE